MPPSQIIEQPQKQPQSPRGKKLQRLGFKTTDHRNSLWRKPP